MQHEKEQEKKLLLELGPVEEIASEREDWENFIKSHDPQSERMEDDDYRLLIRETFTQIKIIGLRRGKYKRFIIFETVDRKEKIHLWGVFANLQKYQEKTKVPLSNPVTIQCWVMRDRLPVKKWMEFVEKNQNKDDLWEIGTIEGDGYRQPK